MAAVLLQVLERTELNKLPKGAQNKLEKFVTELRNANEEQRNANEELRRQRERLEADSEQQYFDIDKRLAESQEQILSATKDVQTLKEENKKLNEELSSLKGIEGETAEDKPPQQQTKAKYELEAEKRELERLLEKRKQEVENLTDDMKRLNEKLTETSKVKTELQLKLDGLQSSEASVQHREKRMEQEKELREKKIEWLTAELKAKTEELLNTNREKGKEILELQACLKNSKEQVTRLEGQLTSLKQTSEKQNERGEDLNNKLKQAKDEQSAMEEKYRNELNAHVKLSSLYKLAATDLETRNQELSRAVEELSKLVKDSGEGIAIKNMEKELETATVKASGKHCCKNTHTHTCCLCPTRGAICTVLCVHMCLTCVCVCCAPGAPSLTEEQLDAMCPSAAAISAIVKPAMKFFDLYNAYAECQTQLQLEKQETRRVSRVLDEIVLEVESKAPVLKRQREEYESMKRSMTSLCNKLEQARTEIYSLQKEKEEAKQRCDSMEREKLRTERQLEDTSTQVCSLLVELEEARGNQVTREDGTSANISSTSEVTSPRQLSFRSVEELQRQNQSLLKQLRELEEEKERQQSQLQKEVEQLKEQRNQQKQLADSSARQRDMYKTLLTQSTGFSLPPQGEPRILSSSHPAPVRPPLPATRAAPQRAAAESAQTAQANAALKQLSDSFALYKKEKAENDRMLNETNERLQKQLTDLRSSHSGTTAYEMLQDNVSAYRREICALQERNQKLSATAQQHEHVIHTMSQDLRQANEKLALEEVRVENFTKERDMLRQAESRLSREKEAVLAEQQNQNLLLTNLKSIQLTMERTESLTRQRLNDKIEHLEAEVASMKTRLDQEVAQKHALGRTMDAQLLEAKKQLETQNTLQQKTRELLRGAEQQVVALKAQLASASSSEAVALSQSEQELAEVKSSLRTAEEQKGELMEQLKNANATVEQYKAVVLTLEDSLKKEKEVWISVSLPLESGEVQKQLEKRILEAEKMKQQEREERRKAMDAVEKQVCELQRTLKSSQAEQQEALERAAAAVTMEQKAIQDSQLQTKLAAEAQAKYERELMLHAADVEALQELKKRSQQNAAQRRELEEQLSKTSSLLQEKTVALSATEKQLKEDLANKTRCCAELGKQNSLLHQQMDEMASRSRQQRSQQEQQLDLSFTEEGKTTEQILEILRFVRREKEIALAQCEASDREALRYKQRVEHQDRELKELQEALNAEREKMQATAKTLAQQQEQLKEMETVSTLQETTRMLKMDRDKLEQELLQAQAKVSKLQSDISPLHHSLSMLSEKNGSLQADKRILEEDLKRWKAKTQQLVSQQKDGDVEERQKLTTEREAQQRRITQLAEETGKLKTELARSSASSNSAQSQLQAFRDSVARLTSERDTLKKDMEAKNKDILEKNKTITQVKKIGRRYKTQYDELKAQHDKNVTNQKELQQTHQSSQQSHNQEVINLKAALSQAESKVSFCNLTVRTISRYRELCYNTVLFLLQLSDSKRIEEQLRQQIAEKEEKTKKVFMGAKTKINQLNSAKEQLNREIEEVKQSKDELEVRMSALKSQYEGRLLRLDRELRELKESQAQPEPREEPLDQSGAKGGDQARSADQRQISLKNPAQDRGSSSQCDPPTANIRPTTSTPSPSNKPSPSSGSKATPRASIRPMVTPVTIPVPTPTATVMPTTQNDSQEGERKNGNVYFLSFKDGSAFGLQEPPEDCFPVSVEEHQDIEEEGVSQSVPSDLMSSQDSAIIREVIVIDTDSESHESKEGEEQPQQEEEDEEQQQEEEDEDKEEEDEEEEEEDDNDTVLFCLCNTSQTQHFFDDDDRMVPSTPTLVVPHRTDGFAEAIHSPQVAGLSTRFRFGPPEDLLPQTSASHSDLGQLASQGGLGMYESPLFLAAHDEDGGGRSVPTTPLQVAAPGDTYTPTDMDSTGQQSDDSSLPSTSHDPGKSFCVLAMIKPLPGNEEGVREGLSSAFRTMMNCDY
uniref:Translocated promoter region a, nuclear basket protein n=1 Tax=Gasterosteus aculeatus aculeatus TaxID=481459 RepID=A0AAQ4R059_GASAC